MPAPAFDLQAHSTLSDGALEPAEVVAAAAAAGVRLLALTDHDTVDGVDEALAAASRAGIELVPAIEISAAQDGAGADVHVLGYRIDHRDPDLRRRLDGFRAARALRAMRMADRLEADGLAVEREPLERRAEMPGASLGRPHLAAVALAHPDNAARLQAEGTAEVGAFIGHYLVPGGAGWVPRTEPTVAEAIETIHAAGGLAVWAHPFFDVHADAEVLDTLERFRAAGLDGVEVFYVTHNRAQVDLLAARCGELGMLQTGSADFHGPDRAGFDRFRAFELYGHEPVLGPIG